jgi:hypothetical protein
MTDFINREPVKPDITANNLFGGNNYSFPPDVESTDELAADDKLGTWPFIVDSPSEAGLAVSSLVYGQESTSVSALSDAVESKTDFIELDEAVSLYNYEGQKSGKVEKIRNYATDIFARTKEVLSAARTDFKESDHKVRALALGSAVVVTEVLDRARLMVFLVPHVATEVFDNTHSPVQGAITGAAVFTAWNIGTAEILTQGLDQLPQAKESFKEEFPLVVEAFRDALPGANKEVVEQEKAHEDKSVFRRIGGFLLRHGARGGTGISLGTTAFVATSSANGDTVNETRKQYLGVSADTAVVTSLVIAGVGQLMFELPKHGQEQLAENIYNVVSSMRTWGVVAVASMVGQYFVSRKLKKEAAMKNEVAKEEQ